MPSVDLLTLSDDELREHLDKNSGIPGPRANLALADEAAELLPAVTLEAFAADPDEFLALIGAEGIARTLADADRRDEVRERLETLARDPRWRVREGVVRGLQRAGDRDPAALASTVGAWIASDDRRLMRAAVAAICEPRLLDNPDLRRVALEANRTATARLVADPDPKDEAWRNLAQALEHTWSVAVAADPAVGLPFFRELEADPSPVVARIVAANAKNPLLRKLL
jgi:hypothetical protein